MKIETQLFDREFRRALDEELHGIDAEVSTYPCDDRWLFGVESFAVEFNIQPVESASTTTLGTFTCNIIGAITPELIATPVNRIVCDFDNVVDLGAIIIAIQRSLKRVIKNYAQ